MRAVNFHGFRGGPSAYRFRALRLVEFGAIAIGRSFRTGTRYRRGRERDGGALSTSTGSDGVPMAGQASHVDDDAVGERGGHRTGDGGTG